MKVVIYTKPDCTYCGRAKKLLSIQDIPYDEIIIGQDITREEFLDLIPTAKTVPQIIIDKVLIGGYNELYNLSLTWSVVNGSVGDQSASGTLED
jgi:glutaredoxin